MTLDQLIRQYLLENGDAQLNKYARAYTIATAGLSQLSMDVSAVPKSVQLPVLPNGIVNLPLGFLNYISINVIGADGRLWGLAKNNEINTTAYYNSCGVQIRKHINTNEVEANINSNFTGSLANPTYLADHFRNGENFGAYFNIGGHNRIGEYKIDYNTKQIFLSALRTNLDFIVLEYISDIQADSGDYEVHPFLVETIKAWIYWKWIQRDRNFSLGEKQVAEQTYNKERRLSVRRFNANTLQELLDCFRSVNSSIPKW